MKEYLTYKSIDLAMDEEFIRYIKHDKDGKKWKGLVDENEDFSSIVEEARELVVNGNFKKYELDNNIKEKIWGNISKHSNAGNKKNIRISLYTMIGSVAAVFALIWLINLDDGSTSINAEVKDKILVSLPDLSKVSLNAGSTLSYNKEDYKKERNLLLEGEGFFEVEKGKKFTVSMENGTVEVLGTSFNIFSRNDSTAVRCYTGSVKVSSESADVILSPGEQVTFLQSKVDLNKENFEMQAELPAWIDGRFDFDNVKLSDVALELERQYGVRISIPSELKSKRYIGSFNNKNLEDALRDVFFAFNLKYEIREDSVIVTK